jgi:hypothetical protein
MSDFRSPLSSSRSGAVRFCATAVLLLLAATGAAHLLSRKLDNGELPTIAVIRSEQGLKRMARSAPAGQAPRADAKSAGSLRGRGIDATATAAISPADAGAISIQPCGQPSQKVFVVRSIGVEGATSAALPPQGAAGAGPCGNRN